MASHNGSLLYHPDSAGHHIFDLNLALIIVSTIFVFLRLFVRGVLVKALGWDDLIATIAWALCVTLSALEMDTTHYGTGAQVKDVPLETHHGTHLTNPDMHFMLINADRGVHVVHIRPQLNRRDREPDRSLLHASDVFNYDASWRQCRDEREERLMVLSQSIIWIFVDCMLVALPLWVVTSYLKMGVNAIQILLVFSVGIFAVATGIARTVIIFVPLTRRRTYKMLPIATWTDAEVHVGLWVGCFPALQPLIRHASFMTGLRGQPHSTVRRSRRDTAMSTDAPTKKSVVNRSSHGSSHLWSGRSENQPKGSLAKGIEMVDLEKGKDSRRIIDQRNIMVDIDLSDTPNATNAENKGKS